MKGPNVQVTLLGVDNPNDPISGAVSSVLWMATPQGAAYVSLFGPNGELAIGDGGMIGAIFDTEQGLNVRSALFTLRYDSTDPQFLQNVSHADFGEVFDISTSIAARAMFTNAGVYGYDASFDDGSMSVAMVSVPTGGLSAALNYLGTLAVTYGHSSTGNAPLRIHVGDGPNVSAASSSNSLMVQPPGEWSLTHAPAADTVATVTRGAPGAGAYNVIKSITADLTAVAAITAPLTLVVRDGASGVGAIIWSRRLTAPAGETKSVEMDGLNIVGSEDTALTVEFTAAPGATNFETISVTGITAA